MSDWRRLEKLPLADRLRRVNRKMAELGAELLRRDALRLQEMARGVAQLRQSRAPESEG